MKLTATVLFTTLTIGTVFGQTVKTYSGNYEDGQATYHYFENEILERVYDGSFVFKRTIANSSNWQGKPNVEITGNFKDNKKDGKWTYKNEYLKSFPEGGYREFAMCSYRAGKLNGFCTLTDYSIRTNEILRKSTASFEDGKLVGKFSFKDNYSRFYFTNSTCSKLSVNGQFNKEGKFDSTWHITYKGNDESYEYIMKFKNGVLFWALHRNLSTGDVIVRFDITKLVDDFFSAYAKNPNNVIINNEKFVLRSGVGWKDDEFISHDKTPNPLSKVISFWGVNLEERSEAFKVANIPFDDNVIFNFDNIGSNSYVSNYLTESSIVKWQFTDEAKEIAQNKLLEDEKLREQKEAEEKEQQELQEAKRKQEQEEEFKKQEAISQFENTEYGRLQRAIKDKFRVWQVKSDFETASDFETRIKNQSADKLKTITDEIINAEKKRKLEIRYSNLGSYNAESQIYPLYVGRTDTILLPITKTFALQFATTFTNKKGGFDRSVIYVLPTEVVMINNKWTVSEAVVLFDNYWTGADFVRNEDFKRFYKENGSYYYDREYTNLDKMAKDIKKYKIESLKSFESATEIPKQVFFYEWKMQTPTANSQKLVFSLEDLNMTSANSSATK